MYHFSIQRAYHGIKPIKQQNSVFLCLYRAGRGRIDAKTTWQCPAALFTPQSCCSTMPGNRPSSELDISQPCALELGCILHVFSQKYLFMFFSLFFFFSGGGGGGENEAACIECADCVPLTKHQFRSYCCVPSSRTRTRQKNETLKCSMN